MLRVSCSLCFVFFWLALSSAGLAQPYFTGPYGPNGTYNLYEIVGSTPYREQLPRIEFGEPASSLTFRNAFLESRNRVETFSGEDAPGHLVTIGSAEENEFVAGLGHRFHIGLTTDEWYLEEGVLPSPGEDGRFWVTGEPRSFTPEVDFEEDEHPTGAQITSDGLWFESSAGSGRRHFVVEYETHLEGPLPELLGEMPVVPGAPDHLGGFRVREVTRNGRVEGLFGAFASLRNVGADANVIDYSTDTINFTDGDSPEGPFGDDQYFRSNVPDPGEPARSSDLSDLALIARAQFEITEEQTGTWDFLVGADDAFELMIADVEFYDVGEQWLGQFRLGDGNAFATPYGSFSNPRDTFYRQYQASIDLTAGFHDLELIFNERSGSAELELSARGPVQDAFHLVGSPTGLQLVPEPQSQLLAWLCLAVVMCSFRRDTRLR